METTIDIDDDVLETIERIAAAQETTPGRVISDLARKGLGQSAPRVRNGVPLLDPWHGRGDVTPEAVNQLRDETP